MKRFGLLVKKLIRSKEFVPILVVLIVGLWASFPLTRPGYYNMHDDLQMLRQLAIEECILDGQIPCRWTKHMGYGFGFPLFNFYPPLPYLVGQGIRVLGFSFVETAKLTFLASFVLSGVFMYVLAKEFWGRLGGLLSSVFYIWGPYHALDVYVRGAMNEAWSFVWFPLALWSSYKLIKEAQFRYIAILALSWFALFTSHNLMVLIFTPLFAFWLLMWLLREKSWFTLPQLIIAGIWGFGLAAFFTFPVLFETRLVHAETLVEGYYNYIVHFPSLYQMLVSRFWGYGASVWELEDNMSFQIGHIHWMLSLAIAGFAIFVFTRKPKASLGESIKKYLSNEKVLVGVLLFVASWFSLFIAHQRSIFIWQAIPPLKFVQFPWRFLTLATLSFSLLAGAIIPLLNNWRKGLGAWLVILLSAGVIFLGKDYFKPERMGPLTDEEKFSGEAYEKLQTSGIFDYLPKTAQTAPKEQRKTAADVVSGEAEVANKQLGTDWASFDVNVKNQEATVRVNILMFPNWKVFVDGKETEIFIPEDEEWGRIYIKVPEGRHEVYAKLYDTPVRTAGNLISLFSWLALFTAPIWRRR